MEGLLPNGIEGDRERWGVRKSLPPEKSKRKLGTVVMEDEQAGTGPASGQRLKA